MKLIKLFTLFLFVFISQTSVFAQTKVEYFPYKDSSLTIEKRINDLIGRMTLEEKCEQLQFIFGSGKVGGTNGELLYKVDPGVVFGVINSRPINQVAQKYNELQRHFVENTRLGIPVLYANEGEYALFNYGSTAFPQSLALASSWDTEVMRSVARVVSSEAKACGIRLVFTPVVNILRDPRWGRSHECYGEDPYLSSRMAVPYVKEWQSNGCISSPKHFVSNTGMDGRFSGPTHFSERILRELFFPAFKSCIIEGGAECLMAAYNTQNGIPCGTNPWLLSTVLRDEWGFDGFVVSDGGALPMILDSHLTAATAEEVASQAIKAGCDMDASGFNFNSEYLVKAVNQGLISEKEVDVSVRRVLRQKFEIGLFENPYVDTDNYTKILDCAEHRQLSLDAARKSMVLLKNDNNTLPFDKDIKSVAVLGPLADDPFGTFYASYGRKEISVLEGIKNYLPNTEVNYEKGAEMYYYSIPPINSEHLFIDIDGERTNGLMGEYFDNPNLEGTPVFKRIDKEIDFNWKNGNPDTRIPKDHFSIRWTGKLISPKSGKYLIGISMDDGARLYIDDELIVDSWSGGSKRVQASKFDFIKGKEYDVKVEYFDGTYNANVILGWLVDPFGQIPAAIEAARKSDIAIIVVGSYSQEGNDRADLDLSEAQERLIIEVAALNKPMVVLLNTGNVITMNKWIDFAPAILETWYPGEEGGKAIAEVLFGDVNPGGKLPVTFPKTIGQVPIRYNRLPSDQKTKGHVISKYVGVGNEPEFCFGHGLSYTSFSYQNLRLSDTTIRIGEDVSVSIDIENTGDVTGDEVVQLYIHDQIASVAQPRKKLQGFERITLKPGETKTVDFVLSFDNLKIWSINNKWEVEPGKFKIMIGSSSQNIRQSTELTILK